MYGLYCKFRKLHPCNLYKDESTLLPASIGPSWGARQLLLGQSWLHTRDNVHNLVPAQRPMIITCMVTSLLKWFLQFFKYKNATNQGSPPPNSELNTFQYSSSREVEPNCLSTKGVEGEEMEWRKTDKFCQNLVTKRKWKVL